MNLAKTFSDLLPEYVRTQPAKNERTVWLPKHQAITHARFQAHLNNRHFLMTDHDDCSTMLAQKHYDIEPNIIIYNPKDERRHQAFWWLRDPVYCHSEAKSRHSYRYLRAIESAYDDKYGCDKHFARSIHRNPLSVESDTDWRHSRSYSLSELAEVIELNKFGSRSAGSRLPDSETGSRNIELFNSLRTWAYRNIKLVRDTKSIQEWHSDVLSIAHAMNTFTPVLTQSEVQSTAKSVAAFSYYRYEPSHNTVVTPEYRARQAERGAKGGKVSKGGGRPSNSKLSKSELISAVVKLKKNGLSNRMIADDLSISASTVSSYLKHAI